MRTVKWILFTLFLIGQPTISFSGERNTDLKSSVKDKTFTLAWDAQKESDSAHATTSGRIIDISVKGISDSVKDGPQKDRKEAIIDAKRQACEKAGIQLKSTTMVENFETVYDYIESKSEVALLPGFQIVDVGYVADGTYQIVLSGKIKIALKKSAAVEKETHLDRQKYGHEKKQHALGVVFDYLPLHMDSADMTFSIYGVRYQYVHEEIGYFNIEGLSGTSSDTIYFAYGPHIYNVADSDAKSLRGSYSYPFLEASSPVQALAGVGFEYISIMFDLDNHLSRRIDKKSVYLDAGLRVEKRQLYAELKCRYMLGEEDKLGYEYGASIAIGIRF